MVHVIRAQEARFLRQVKTSLDAFRLGRLAVVLPFATASRCLFRNAAWGCQKIGSSLDLIQVALKFAVIFRRRFTPQLALNLVHINPNTIRFAVTLLGHSSIVQPLFRREVNRFGAIISDIVPGVVPIGVSNNKFALVVD